MFYKCVHLWGSPVSQIAAHRSTCCLSTLQTSVMFSGLASLGRMGSAGDVQMATDSSVEALMIA
jgi:hypothetical protein